MKQTTKKKPIRQFLTLMLAFVMVFTGMGIGSWGVDEAWADNENEIPVIVCADDSNITVWKSNLTEYELAGEKIPITLYEVTVPINTYEIKVSTQMETVQAIVDYEYSYKIDMPENSMFYANEPDINNEQKQESFAIPNPTIFFNANENHFNENDQVLYLEFTSNFDDYVGEFGLIIVKEHENQIQDGEYKSALNEMIGNADAKNKEKYHNTNDRYNGTAVSANGFWADMENALDNAKKIQEHNPLPGQIKKAIQELSKAIDNLIPISQINPTALYEAVNTEWVWTLYQGTNPDVVHDAATVIGDEGVPISAENCTNVTWMPYVQAKAAADKRLKEIFLDGKPTDKNVNDEDGNAQKEADALAAAADPQQLVNQELYDSYYEQYMNHREEAGSLLKQYDPEKLTESDYDSDSWNTYKNAYEALKTTYQHKNLGGTREDYEVYKNFFVGVDMESQAKLYQTDALISAYNLLKSTADVTVSLTYVNNLTAAYPQLSGGTDAYRKQDIKLVGETNVYGALQAENIEYAVTTREHPTTGNGGKIELPLMYGKTMPSTALVTPYLSVFVNGEFRGIYAGAEKTKAVNLKNGDKVTVARVLAPQELSEASSGLTSTNWSWAGANRFEYEDSLAMIALTAEKTTVKVGDKLHVSASVTDAYGENFGEARSAKGLTLFVSEPSETESITAPSRNTAETTDANGKTSYTFTKSGWYTIALYDLQEDSYTLFDVYQNYTMGNYHSLVAGDIALVYVEAVDDEKPLIEKYRKENLAKAKTLFDAYTEYDFADGYYENTWKTAYEALKSKQENAASFDALMTQFDEDYANLQKLAKENAADYAGITETITEKLRYIPEDLEALDESYADAILEIQQTYGSLSAADEKRDAYQKRFFTPKELERLDAIAKLDVKTFKELRTITVNVKDFRSLPLAVGIGQSGGSSLHGWPQLTWSMTPNLDGSVPEPVWADIENGEYLYQYRDTFNAKAGDHAYVRAYLDTDDEKYWMVWSVDGENWNLAEPQTLKSYDGEWISGYYLADYQIPKDIDTDTITIAVKMISKAEYEEIVDPAETPEQLAAAKTAALESLKAAYQAYDEANYTPDNWIKLTEAYEKGKTDIEAAATSEAAADARKAAIAAMAAIAAKGGSEDPGVTDYDSGKTVGKVYVSIENTKYPGGDFTGTIAGGWYDLGENDSMMTCVLKALKQAGYSWNGTAGSSKDKIADYSITYLSSIQKGDKSLGEFDGSSKSGWMGILNDWFVNQGFHAFTVKNGQLENGDEIHVMFTMAYGEDLGGTWNNTNTKLAGLTVSGGTLSPAFSGSQNDYTLIISGDKANVTVTPEAANKNYQARIFLNRYNQDGARYKRTETISVKSGDILYVGVGESGWPTMNAGGVGTKYTIKVVSGSDASAVKNMLTALKDITYNNYRAEKGNVEAARAAYNALTAEAKKNVSAEELKKLTDAEAQIEFYSEIDDAKAKLNALTSSSSSSQAREALAAYEKLSKEQKEYITKADAERFNELAKKYNLNPISGVEEMPESEVATTGKVGSASTSSPTEVKMTGTTAVATVKAENQKEILKQAKENQSSEVILVVADTDAKGADKVELNLDKAFLQSLLKDTKAKLIVKTPFGQKTYDREAMQALIDSAAGNAIKAEINADNVDKIDDEAAKLEKAKELTASLALTARSAKTAKKNVKVTLKLDKASAAAIAELQDMGYTVKYKFYRSTKKASKYAAKITKTSKTFTNTKGVKGKKYYYKARVMVYDESGKLVTYSKLTQCKYAARTWTK